MNRDFKIILILMGAGFVMITGLFAYENSDETIPTAGESEFQPEENAGLVESDIHLDLEKKIDSLSGKAFDPQSFSVLSTEIASHHQTGSYTEAIKRSLENRLLDTYSALVFKEAESFLLRETGNSERINDWLNQVEENGADDTTVSHYRDQIKWHNYYAYTLPARVHAFIQQGITNYTDEDYEKFKIEISDMPRLEQKYQTYKFTVVRKRLLYNLGEFYKTYYLPDYEPLYDNM